MREKTRFETVAQISGYLLAISALSGELRDYEFSSFCIELGNKRLSVCELINEYYREQYKFQFDKSQKFNYNFRELEVRVRHHLIKDQKCVMPNRIDEIQHYMSFRIMDMIGVVFDEKVADLRILEVRENCSLVSQDTIFICIYSVDLLLVLQFNCYTPTA